MEQPTMEESAQEAYSVKKKPVLGIVSAGLGGAALLIITGYYVILILSIFFTPNGFFPKMITMMTAQIGFITGMVKVLSSLGFIAGLIAVFQRNRTKKAALAGIICGAISFLLTFILPVIVVLLALKSK